MLTRKKEGFSNANLIELRWNIEFGTDNVATKYIYRMMIAENGQFSWKYPIHASPVPNKNVHPVVITYRDIEIDHKKDRTLKQGRYSQTAQMLMKALNSDYKDDPYLLFTGAEVHIFDKNYPAAISLLDRYLEVNTDAEEKRMLAVEKITHCYLAQRRVTEAQALIQSHDHYRKYPRFLLLVADVTSLVCIDQAEKLYVQFLQRITQLKSSTYSYDIERYEVHPYLMLAKIAFQQDNTDKVRTYVDHVLVSTHNMMTRYKALSLINKK